MRATAKHLIPNPRDVCGIYLLDYSGSLLLLHKMLLQKTKS